jgi:hypothetical protein
MATPPPAWAFLFITFGNSIYRFLFVIQGPTTPRVMDSCLALPGLSELLSELKVPPRPAQFVRRVHGVLQVPPTAQRCVHRGIIALRTQPIIWIFHAMRDIFVVLARLIHKCKIAPLGIIVLKLRALVHLDAKTGTTESNLSSQ